MKSDPITISLGKALWRPSDKKGLIGAQQLKLHIIPSGPAAFISIYINWSCIYMLGSDYELVNVVTACLLCYWQLCIVLEYISDLDVHFWQKV